jgi:hypothetical protein
LREPVGEKYYSEKEAAEFIKRKPSTLKTWRCLDDKKGPKYRTDNKGKIFYRESDLREFMEGTKKNN